jgi:hypothetical protein
MNDVLRTRNRGVLVDLVGNAPFPWRGDVVRAADAGPLCTQRPDRLTIWAGSAGWPSAFRLLAMCKSAAPEECLVLSGARPVLDQVPSDARVGWVVDGELPEPVISGRAPYLCRDLRSDRIFRLLLSGRVRRRPELRRLLDRHGLLATPHGRRLLRRWGGCIIPVLFAGGLEGMMPEELRADLEELADAARDAEHAVTGGFHVLDPVVRDPADWEEGARRYLPLAAARSPEARTAVWRWLGATRGWAGTYAARREAHRITAAAVLHRLADDPWLPGREVEERLLDGVAA